METVITFLIVIIVLLSLLLIISFLKNKTSVKGKETRNTVDHVIAQIVEQEEQELIGDYELVAAITAAIYAFMGDAVPADGLIVRSIRKVNSKRRLSA